MSNRTQLVGAFFAVLMTVSGAVAAQPVVTRVFTSDKFSYALYFQTSADGCESMALEVFATNSMSRDKDGTNRAPIVRAQVSAFNYCTNVYTFMSGADESPALFTNKDLTLSTASATVQLTDEFGTMHMLLVNLTWSDGVLTTDRERTKVFYTSPRSRTKIKTNASVRQSETVTGSLVLDGLDLLGANNPSAGSFANGYVTSTKGAYIEIIRY